MPKRREVDTWFRGYDNPMKETMLRVRQIILAADRRMDECIKWQSPTFTYEGNLASFNPRSKKHASLMFHTGGKIPGRHPKLQGGKGTARYMTFTDPADAARKKKDLVAVVKAWVSHRDGLAGTKKKAPKKKTAPKKKAAPKRIAVKKTTTRKPASKKRTAAKKKTAQSRKGR